MLITAGPTHEPIDPVRYIANRSSGKMGAEIARAAADDGWSVTLLLGPTTVPAATAIRLHRFETSFELRALLADHFPKCDVLVMAAAVADFRPATTANEKIARRDSGLTLALKPTPDLVGECCARKREDQFVIGFALEEPDQLQARAREKLRRKRLDAIVANPLETIGAHRIRATIITMAGDVITPGGDHVDKPTFARFLVRWISEATPQDR